MRCRLTNILTVFVLFFWTPYALSAQMNSSLDFIAGTDYSYRYFGYEGASPGAIFRLSLFSTDRAGLGWRCGFNHNTVIGRDLSLRIGTRIVKAGFKVDPNYGGGHDSDLEVFDFWFFELPLALRYEMDDRKLTPFIEAGFAPTFYLGSSLGRNISKNRYEEKMDLVHWVLLFGGGYNYKVNEHLEFFYQANFRYDLNGIELFHGFSDHLYSIGLEFGFRKQY